MLSEDFYTIGSITKEENSAEAAIVLNAMHPIYTGHFPGQPVVPGACILQMVKEIMQEISGKELRLIIAHNLKFISLIDPSKNDTLQIKISHSISGTNEIPVTATLSYDSTVCFKFNGIFGIQQ